jgi:hypothetical protein
LCRRNDPRVEFLNCETELLADRTGGLPLGGVAPRLAGVLLRCKMAIVACFNLIVILNLFQDNKLP